MLPMAKDVPYKICFVSKSREEEEEEEEDEKIYKRYEEIVATLPTTGGWSGHLTYQYQGFWYDSRVFGVGPLAVQDHFKARPSDILLASSPKCGTTWLKSLAFAVMNRKSHPPSSLQHPLHIFNSHDLVPFLEIGLYNNKINGNRIPNLDIFPLPRLFGTHMPYTSLPESVVLSDSRIVYICRNAKDNLVSWWHFINKYFRSNMSLEPIKLEQAFEWFCKGMSPMGPFWDHVLGYWKGSLERPRNVLFLKYEELLAEPARYLERMADFMGCPFSIEEREAVVDQILKLCSFENLSNVEVNKTGTRNAGLTNSAFFRQGKVGDSVNFLTPEMMEQLDRITEEKLHGSGLKL